jgi:hypothetical protein
VNLCQKSQEMRLLARAMVSILQMVGRPERCENRGRAIHERVRELKLKCKSPFKAKLPGLHSIFAFKINEPCCDSIKTKVSKVNENIYHIVKQTYRETYRETLILQNHDSIQPLHLPVPADWAAVSRGSVFHF